jgi:hypothetical protein
MHFGRERKSHFPQDVAATHRERTLALDCCSQRRCHRLADDQSELLSESELGNGEALCLGYEDWNSLLRHVQHACTELLRDSNQFFLACVLWRNRRIRSAASCVPISSSIGTTDTRCPFASISRHSPTMPKNEFGRVTLTPSN